MRIASSADWRDGLPFDRPILVSEVAPGEPARCAVCGPDAPPRARDELWAVKHRHPKHHGGFVRFYCAEHAPRPAQPAAAVSAPAARRSRGTAEARTPRAPRATRATGMPNVARAVCPDCFIEVNAKGECGTCGWTAA